MSKLLWLITVALGTMMLWEMSCHLSLRWMFILQRVLLWVATLWVISLAGTAVWYVRTFK